jgi:peptidoglycan/xylan/chitin deacetylase (PgdA/CDA1 family)
MKAPKRDMVGYGRNPPEFSWPGGKKLAVSVVINYEEGSEHSYPVDRMVEGVGEFLPIDVRARDVGNESAYEYGSRVAIWRVLDTFAKHGSKGTFYATAEALQINPQAAKAIVEAGHEICDHGLRWTEHYRYTLAQERKAIRKSVEIIEELTGKMPVGFYAREPSVNTLNILEDMGNFIYDSDAYNDDRPYRHNGDGILILPYAPDANDFHFMAPMHRFATSGDFFDYLKDSFEALHDESASSSKMMSVGLHNRIIGRPGRIAALHRFLSLISGFDDVWVATREEIARYWIENVEPTIVRK